MHKNHLWLLGLVLVVLGGAFWLSYGTPSNEAEEPTPSVASFEDCARAGYPVMESHPRQCKTPDGRTYAEELPPPPVTYGNASADLIVIDAPTPGAVTGKSFQVQGRARGTWYFEASFPVTVVDKEGNALFEGHATAEGDWMTEAFVPFSISVQVPDSFIGEATVVLKNDNPSGDPSRDRLASFPITIEY